MTIRKESVDSKTLWLMIVKELEAMQEDSTRLNEIQLEIVSKLTALRLALNSPDFEEGHSKDVLDQIYDNMYDLSESVLKEIRENHEQLCSKNEDS